jgi:hypothetical protein
MFLGSLGEVFSQLQYGVTAAAPRFDSEHKLGVQHHLVCRILLAVSSLEIFSSQMDVLVAQLVSPIPCNFAQ